MVAAGELQGPCHLPLPGIMLPMASPENPAPDRTSFLESLRLGSLWFGKRADRLGRPIFWRSFVGLAAGRVTACSWLALPGVAKCAAGVAARRPSTPWSPRRLVLSHRLDARTGKTADEQRRPQAVPLQDPAAALHHRRLLVRLQSGRRDRCLVRRLAPAVDSALQRHIVLLVSRTLRVFLTVIGTLFVVQSVFRVEYRRVAGRIGHRGPGCVVGGARLSETSLRLDYDRVGPLLPHRRLRSSPPTTKERSRTSAFTRRSLRTVAGSLVTNRQFDPGQLTRSKI